MKETNYGTYSREMKDKVEKIVAALHVLTSHFEDTEFLKSSVRTSAVTLLTLILSDKDGSNEVSKLSSFIRVAILSQQIRKENGELILGELAKVTFEKDEKDTLADMMDMKVMTAIEASQKTFSSDTTQLKKEEQKATPTFVPEPTPAPRSEPLKAWTHSPLKVTPTVQKDNVQSFTPRRQKVMSLLSKTDTKSIRDISRHFNDCSEKTIQRELNDMVESNIIIRVGDRRWSTYKLA